MIADKLLDMNIFELKYFSAVTREKLTKTSGTNPMKINLDWPSVKADGKNKKLSDIYYRYWIMATRQS